MIAGRHLPNAETGRFAAPAGLCRVKRIGALAVAGGLLLLGAAPAWAAPIQPPAVEADAVHEINGEGKITVFGVVEPNVAAVNEVQSVTLGGVGTGDLTAGSEEVSGVSTTTGAFVAGEEITGAGIPPATTIGTVDAGAGKLVLSKPAESTAMGVSLNAGPTGGSFNLSFEGQSTGGAGTGTLTAGSTEVKPFTVLTGAFVEGEAISGSGIPPGTTITSAVGPGLPYISLSNPVTESDASAALTTAIPYNAEPSVVEGALGELSPLGKRRCRAEPCNVAVTAGPEKGDPATVPYTVEFRGEDSGESLPLLGVEDDALTPAGTPVTVATVQEGFSHVHYHFEFVTEEQYEKEGFAGAVSTPETGIGPAGTVGAQAPALLPETGYDFRLVAENSALAGVREVSQVKRIPKPHPLEAPLSPCPNEAVRYGASARLPDCRAYEQVTPAEKGGAQSIFGYEEDNPETSIADDGEHFLLHEVIASWGQNVSGAFHTNSYDFTRSQSGWGMTSLNPQPATAQFQNSFHDFFNEGFSQFMIERFWETSENAVSPDVEYTLGPAGGPYTVVASEPVVAAGIGASNQKGHWAGESRDGSVAVIESSDHELIPGRPTHTTGENTDLYAYSPTTGLTQVNVETGGGPIGSVGTCAASLVQGREAGERGGDRARGETGGSRTGGVNSISGDGSRVFFYDSPGECSTQKEVNVSEGDGLVGSRVNLYMRLTAGGETYDIGAYTFEGANPQGTRLLLGRRGLAGLEYFSYDTETHVAKHAFTLQQPIGEFHSMSEDGNVLYFESNSVLNRETTGDRPSLYSYDLDSETLTFITHPTGTHGGPYGAPYATTLEGRGFYWTQDVPEPGLEQPFAYDSAEQVVWCVACASPYDPEPRLPSTYISHEGADVLMHAPLVTQASANGDFVFFDSPDALVPQDVNGEINPYHFEGHIAEAYSSSSDVYEWRRYGIDGCTARQGCLALITDGIDGTRNVLLGTDPSGRDVFFSSSSQLVGQDKDSVADVYDARIGGGFPPPAAGPTECEGDSCSTPFAAPQDLTPSSSTFEGAGDITPESGPPVAVKTKHEPRKAKARKRKGKGVGKRGRRARRARRTGRRAHGAGGRGKGKK
jgi:hypothetical protein